MNCPKCGKPEKALFKMCPDCKEVFASEDYLEFHQLEYLVNETATWKNVEADRNPYVEKWEKLKNRLRRKEVVESKPVEKALEPVLHEKPAALTPTLESSVLPEVAITPEKPVPTPKPEPTHPQEPTPQPEPAEKVPFDQWLLSERNIRIALYSGGILLVLAGVIFIGVNWTRIPGPAKFAVTSLVTGLMYLGGYLLFQRDAFRIGGVALLGIASGFLTLNFAVLQIYVLGPNGVQDDVMWLIASPLCLLLYMLTAYWTRTQLFSYISIAAIISTLSAALVVASAPETIYYLSFAILFLVFQFLAFGANKTVLKDFTYQPLLIVAHIGMPLVLIISIFSIFTNEYPWLFTSIIGLLFYLFATFWNRFSFLTYASMAACFSMTGAILTSLNATYMVFVLTYAILLLLLGVLAIIGRETPLAAFTRIPIQIVSNSGMPIVLGLALVDGFNISPVNAWLAISTLGIGILLYVLQDVIYHWLATRWAASFLFAFTFFFITIELDFSHTVIGISLMLLALVYMGIGYGIQQKTEESIQGWPLYAIAYLVAGLVTLQAVPKVDDLILVLFGDVILLAVSAAIHRNYWWVYGAVWLLMLPIYLTIDLYVPKFHHQGLLMGVLCLNYLVAGYLLGRRKLQLGGPFLSAAAFLSVVVTALTWSDTVVATIVLVLFGILYLFTALWLEWPWLLFPALLAVNLIILTVNSLIFPLYNRAFGISLIISYAVLGFILIFGDLGLRRNNQNRWGWPLVCVGLFNLGATYLASFGFGNWLVVGLSTALSALSFAFAWIERELWKKIKFPPLLTYTGLGIIFIAHFFLLDSIFTIISEWPIYTAILCAVFVALAWIIRDESLKEIYSVPLRRLGLWLFIIPTIGSIALFESAFVAIAFGIAGFTMVIDAVLRGVRNMVYLGIGGFIIMIWAILIEIGVEEAQAYTIPISIVLLGIGWSERIRGGGLKYRVPTILGLFILMGSAFFQSLPREGIWYAILLLVESIAAVFWGIRTKSRGYVQLGVIAILANAIVQLGPGFIDLPRWVQIGSTGIILLGGGMAALVKREQILATRQKLTEEWRSWES